MEIMEDCSDSKTYTVLESFKQQTGNVPKPTKPLSISSESNLLSWQQCHPENWTTEQVLDWLFFMAESIQAGGDFHGERFQDFNGKEMRNLTRLQFQERDNKYGGALYDHFQQLLRGATYKPPTFNEGQCYDSLESEDVSAMQTNIEFLDDNININGEWYDIDLDTDFNLNCDVTTLSPTTEMKHSPTHSDESGYTSGESDCSDMLDAQIHCIPIPKPTTATIPTFLDTWPPITHSAPEVKLEHAVPRKRSVGRPRKTSSSSEEGCDNIRKRGRKPGQGSKGNHLWEFIRDLLKDPNCSKMIKWEDESLGVFRFVQSENVAKLWGKRKNNPGMTYEKLSRAMRFSRTAGYFSALPTNNRHMDGRRTPNIRHYYSRGILEKTEGRRLVYKFGSQVNLKS
ncbi:unnamed protein product [Owenia fusiformis]|uniref:ETS domain-containing protein n=1 Tax=Owenia fusiformis TaxID=6347 RepID=A0A8S4P2H0_OWEFU|nr:unnamed protein product [Owenia fusiformis]